MNDLNLSRLRFAQDSSFSNSVRIWYDPVNAYPETGGLTGRWNPNTSDDLTV